MLDAIVPSIQPRRDGVERPSRAPRLCVWELAVVVKVVENEARGFAERTSMQSGFGFVKRAAARARAGATRALWSVPPQSRRRPGSAAGD